MNSEVYPHELPLISVIIPVFNCSPYIEVCINSVLCQSYKNVEIIAIDDGSTDSSKSKLESLSKKDDRLKVFYFSVNSGSPAAPRNKGLNLARGDYIAFLDADDAWFPHKLKIQLNVMLKLNLTFSSCLVKKSKCLSKTFRVYGNEHNRGKTQISIKDITHDKLLKKNYIATSSVLLHRDIIDNLVFSDSPQNYGLEDFDFWLKLHKKNINSGFINFLGVAYRVRANSLSRSKLIMALRVFKYLGKYSHSDVEKFTQLKRLRLFLNYIKGSINSEMYK